MTLAERHECGRDGGTHCHKVHRRLAFHAHYSDLLHEMMSANTALRTRLVDDPEFNTAFREYMFRSYSRAVQGA